MKARLLKELVREITQIVVEETSSAPKFYWLDPDGKFHRVPAMGHHPWAVVFLTKMKGVPPEEAEKDSYGQMAKHGWYRVVFVHYKNKYILEYDSPMSRPPTSRQVKSIKDLAIELQADEVHPAVFDDRY